MHGQRQATASDVRRDRYVGDHHLRMVAVAVVVEHRPRVVDAAADARFRQGRRPGSSRLSRASSSTRTVYWCQTWWRPGRVSGTCKPGRSASPSFSRFAWA